MGEENTTCYWTGNNKGRDMNRRTVSDKQKEQRAK